MQIIGYKLIKVDDETMIECWGGTPGQLSTPPAAIFLPGDIQVHCPEIDVEYSGYKLIYWMT
jgi:hypothetical protein